MGLEDERKMKLKDTNDINRGDTTAAGDLLWTIDHLLNEQLRKCSLTKVISVDNLRFYWIHKKIDAGIYDTHWGIPPNLEIFQEYLLDGRFDSTILNQYTVIGPKEVVGAEAGDFHITGMLINTGGGPKRYYLRSTNHPNRCLTSEEQREAVLIVRKFFTMGVSGNDKETIEEVLSHESLQTVRKALRQVFTVVWEHLPDVNYMKQRFASGTMKTLAQVMKYIAEILGVKQVKPDLKRFYSLFNSIPALMAAGISGPSLMTCLREEIIPFTKRHGITIDLGEMDIEEEPFKGVDTFGPAMNFIMFCQVFGKQKKTSNLEKLFETLALRMKKSVDELEIEDIIAKETKKQIYQEWGEKKNKIINFKKGVWDKCYAQNRDNPSQVYIELEKLKSYNFNELNTESDEEGDVWVLENPETGEEEFCQFRNIRQRMRGGRFITRGPQRGRQQGGRAPLARNFQDRTRNWVNNRGQPNRLRGNNRPRQAQRDTGMNRTRQLGNRNSKFRNKAKVLFDRARAKRPRYRDQKRGFYIFTEEESLNIIESLEKNVFSLIEEIYETKDENAEVKDDVTEILELEELHLNEGKQFTIENLNCIELTDNNHNEIQKPTQTRTLVF